MAPPKPSPSGPILGFWPPNPRPQLAQPNVRPHRRCHLVHTIPPPPPIAHHRCFQRHTPNQALVGRFQAFGPNPLPEPRVSDRTATPPPPPPPPQQQHHSTTPPHHPP